MQHIIDVQSDTPCEVPPEAVRQAVTTVLQQEGVTQPCEVAVVLSDDETLQTLNRRFRGVNRPTDVLSFANDTRGPFSVTGEIRYLGDIVISLERAEAQAQAAGGTLTQEVQVLTVHGTLHLLGYDHATPEDKARMWDAQAEALQHLGVTIRLPE